MLTFAKLLNGNMLTGQDQPLDHLFGWYKNGSVTHNRPAPTWVVVFLAILSNEILCLSHLSVRCVPNSGSESQEDGAEPSLTDAESRTRQDLSLGAWANFPPPLVLI